MTSKLRRVKERSGFFDGVRKKFVVLTPEEWVRQNFVNYLILEHLYPNHSFGLKVVFSTTTFKAIGYTRSQPVGQALDAHRV